MQVVTTVSMLLGVCKFVIILVELTERKNSVSGKEYRAFKDQHVEFDNSTLVVEVCTLQTTCKSKYNFRLVPTS